MKPKDSATGRCAFTLTSGVPTRGTSSITVPACEAPCPQHALRVNSPGSGQVVCTRRHSEDARMHVPALRLTPGLLRPRAAFPGVPGARIQTSFETDGRVDAAHSLHLQRARE